MWHKITNQNCRWHSFKEKCLALVGSLTPTFFNWIWSILWSSYNFQKTYFDCSPLCCSVSCNLVIRVRWVMEVPTQVVSKSFQNPFCSSLCCSVSYNLVIIVRWVMEFPTQRGKQLNRFYIRHILTAAHCVTL